MQTKNKILLILLVCAGFLHAQNNAVANLRGKVMVECTSCPAGTQLVSAENINVLNSRTQQATVTNAKGEFNISVKIGDLLILSSFNLENKRKYVRAEDIRGEMLILKMEMTVTELAEVVVNDNSEINAKNLGIGATKTYTPSERKVRTATTGLLDPLFNKLSGRTKMLKKQVAVEKNERLLMKLDGLYEDKYYIEELKIPEEYIGGFQYYIVEDPDFAAALEAKNKSLTMFYVKKLTVDYVDLIQQEQAEAQQRKTE